MIIEMMLGLLIIAVLAVVIGIKIKLANDSKPRKLELLKRLTIIESHHTNDIRGLKTTLLELDKLLDHSLKTLGFRGETMGERLKNSFKAFERKMYNDIWEAHKLRNKLAHEIDFEPGISSLNEANRKLKQAIRHLLK